jgi:hypothetical protein
MFKCILKVQINNPSSM